MYIFYFVSTKHQVSLICINESKENCVANLIPLERINIWGSSF